MLTIEKFYFNFKEAAGHITMGGDASTCHLTLVGDEHAPVNIQITMMGTENFRQLIQHIHDMGMALIDLRRDEPPSAGTADPVASERH